MVMFFMLLEDSTVKTIIKIALLNLFEYIVVLFDIS